MDPRDVLIEHMDAAAAAEGSATTGSGAVGSVSPAEVLASSSVRQALGNTLVAEELRGDFAAARRAAEADGDFEGCVVDMISGRSGAARRRLAALSAAGTQAQRTVAGSLARLADRIYFADGPLHAVVSFDDLARRAESATYPADTDPQLVGPMTANELRLLRGYCGLAVSRANASSVGDHGYSPEHVLPIALPGRTRGTSVAEFVALARSTVSDLIRDLADAPVRPCSMVWLVLADADLVRRAGDAAAALTVIRAARERCEQTNEHHGAGLCWLAESDLRACRTGSPATLGLSIERTTGIDNAKNPRVELREHARTADGEIAAARAAVDSARACFAAACSPRGLAAAELRLAGLAALTGDHARAGEHAKAAEIMFTACGDDGQRYLARVHSVLADAARTLPVSPDRVTEIGTWGAGAGDLCNALGLGALIAAAGRRWLFRDAGYEQAVRCARLAEALFVAAGAPIAAAQALGDQAAAHELIGDRAAAITALERADDQLAIAGPVVEPTTPALARHVRLLWSDVAIGSTPQIAERRVQIQQAAWQLAFTGDDFGAMQRVAARLATALTGLGSAVHSQWLADAARRNVQLTAVELPLSVARAIELDPIASDERRREAWQAVAAAVAQLSDPDRSLYTAILQRERGERAASAEAIAAYFAQEPAWPLALSADAPDEFVELVRHTMRRDHAKQAFAAFLRFGDAPRARAQLAVLAALDGEDWWMRSSPAWHALAQCGDLLRAEDDPAGALAIYTRARDLLEAQGAMLRDDSSRTAFADSVTAQRLYIHAAFAALATTPPDPARAFDFIERGRARALADLISDVRTVTGGNAPIVRWREACARRDLVRTLLASAPAAAPPDPERVAALQRQLDEREREIANLEIEARARSPERFLALDTRTAVAPLSEVRARLPEHVVVIELALVDRSLLGWAITRCGMTATLAQKLDDDRELRRNVRRFQRACATPGESLAAGDRLSEVLLTPFADAVRAASQVVFVVSGELALVPFHALPFDGDALIARVTVSYAPSASLLGVLSAKPVAGSPILAVGDPPDMSISAGEGPLRPLPGARIEAHEIAALVPGSRLLVDDASRSNVAAALPQFRVVHLATHGVVDHRSPWLSAILLARGDQLTVADLMGLELTADLVVLSACDSGTGEVTHGEEVLGLARGLLAAGARAVIVSLWSVNDQATRLLMVELHRRLQTGARPAVALRAAQLHLRGLDAAAVQAASRSVTAEQASALRKITLARDPPRPAGYAHPTYWAPFVLVGM